MGGNDKSGTITNCNATGSVTGSDYIGGLVGRNLGEITDCHATGEVGGDVYTGGLVGWNEGTIANCTSTGSVVGNGDILFAIGGLVGGSDNGSTITNCYATGKVTGVSRIGGLVGYNSGEITGCHATGSVMGRVETGGLVGWNDDTGTITNCYATGWVTGAGSTGGLVGWNDSEVINSFWDTQTSRQPTSDGGMGKTTVQMGREYLYTDEGWDFVETWGMVEFHEYPILRTFPVCIQTGPPPGDANGDCRIDMLDFSILASFWLEDWNW